MSWPPWQNAFDPDPDRQQARRVLRWLTGAADAIPLLDLDRGRYVGARLYFARTDDELRQVRNWADYGIRQHGDLPATMHQWDAERPWRWPASWMDAAWLRGAIAYLDWILGDTAVTPVTRQRKRISPGPHPDPRVIAGQRRMFGVGAGRYDIEEEAHLAQLAAQQGRESGGPAGRTGTRRRNGARQSSRPTTGPRARTASRPLTITAAETTSPAQATAPATTPGTASAASAPPVPTASATQDGRRSRKATTSRSRLSSPRAARAP